MKKHLLLMMALLFASIGLATAQTLTVTGKVVAEKDGQPVAGAYVLVNGTTLGTITNENGEFGIRSVPADAKEIIVSFLGYSTASAPVQAEPLKIVMYEDATYLEETIVTALGISRSEKAIGYAATKVDGDEIAASRNTNALDALQGKVAGLQIQATSSDPGSANSVTIRGFSSINNSNQPLYVVDGVPLQNGTLTSQGHSISTAGIANIAPDDIASMTILKGAAATALYGSRASNGVIVITTKTGKKEDGKNFTLSYNGGMQFRQVSLLPEMQNKWGQGWNGAQTFIENGSWGPALDGSLQVYGPIWNNSQKYHTYDSKVKNVEEFFDLGISHNHNVSLSGVSRDKSMTYFLSYSHTSDNGIMPTDKDMYKRNTISMRNTYDAAKWLKVSSSFNFANSATDIVGSYQGTSVIDGLLEMPRDMSIVDLKDLSDPFNTPEAYLTPYGITNPYWAMENNYNHTNSKQMFGKVQADFKPLDFLTFTYRFGFDYSDFDFKSGTPQIELDDALINEDYGYAPSSMNANGAVSNRYYRSADINHDFMVNFNKTFAQKLDINAVAGVNVWERNYTYMDGTTENLTFHTGFWDLSNGSTKSVLSETQMRRRLIGLFGDVTLGWDNMLFLNLTARNDWSSTLPIGNNNYFYPGATLSWVFTELFPNKVLTFGKARLAYGKTGNDAGAYMTSAKFVQGYADGYYQSDIISFPMNGTNAFLSSTTIGSQSLRPEMTSEFEVGLNLQFFDGRIGLDAAYYNRTTSDQIFTLPVDPATGYSSMVTNFGQVRNRGVELLLSTTPVHTRNFRWDLDVNFALNKNKVLSMPESLEGGKVTINGFAAGDDAVYMYAEVGKPLGTLYTYLPKKVTDENSPYFGAPIVDANGQPVLGDEVEFTGLDVNHKWTGGVTTSFSFYGVTLSATLDARVGGTMFSRTKNLMQFTGNSVITGYNERRPFIIPNSVVDAGDGTYVPNTVPIQQTDGSYQDYFDLYGWGNGGTSYLLDRSFAKLRNVSITWDLPKKWLNKAHIAGLSLSAFVNNAFVWTASDNYYIDPETTTEGPDLDGAFGELYTNPSNRIYGFNLNIKF